MEQERWLCKCSRLNPLHAQKCLDCGQPMPNAFAEHIYRSVLKEYKDIFRQEAFQKSVVRCKKIGEKMVEFQTLWIACFVSVFVLINLTRFSYCTSAITQNLHVYMEEKAEHISSSINGIVEAHWNGIRTLPLLLKGASGDLHNSVKDVIMSVRTIENGFGEDFQEDKVARIIVKIGETLGYGTKEFR